MTSLDHRLTKLAQWLTGLMPLFILIGSAGGDIAASILAVLFLAHSVLTRDFAWLKERWVQLALLLWVFMTLRGAFAEDALLAAGRGGGWVRYPLFAAALAFWSLRDKATQRLLFFTLVLSVLFLIADTLWQYAFYVDIIGRPRLDYQSVVRLTGPFSNPRVGFTIVALVFPALLYVAGSDERARRWLFSLILGTAAAIAIYLSGERMALLLYLLGLGLSFLLMPRARMLIVTIFLLAAAGGVVLTLHQQVLAARQVAMTQSQFGSGFWQSGYGQTWHSALAIAAAHPWIGVGNKEFSRECAKPEYGGTSALALHYRCPMHPHNIYLEWLAENGFIGLGLYAAMLACWIAIIARRGEYWSNAALAAGLVVELLVRLWPLSVTTSLFSSWAATPFWLIAGWLLALLARDAPLDDPGRLR